MKAVYKPNDMKAVYNQMICSCELLIWLTYIEGLTESVPSEEGDREVPKR